MRRAVGGGQHGRINGCAGSWVGEAEANAWHDCEEQMTLGGAQGADGRGPWRATEDQAVSRPGSSGVRKTDWSQAWCQVASRPVQEAVSPGG